VLLGLDSLDALEVGNHLRERGFKVAVLRGGQVGSRGLAQLSAVEVLELNGERPAADASARALDDPWEGIVDTAAARTALGFRPIYPSVYAARDAGVL
jgi:hypothetical protein